MEGGKITLEKHYFIALELPKRVKEELYESSKNLKQWTLFRHWTHKEDYHLTIRFLGAVTELDKIKQVVKEVVEATPKFTLQLNEINVFGLSKRPRVLWYGPEKNSSLENLYNKLSYELELQLAIATENRPFKPHVTIAKKWNSDLSIEQQFFVEKPIHAKIGQVNIYEIIDNVFPKYKIVASYSLI